MEDHALEHVDWMVEIIAALIGFVAAAAIWFCRFILAKVNENRDKGIITCDKLALLELKIAEEYVSAITFKESIAAFRAEAAANHRENQERFAKLENYIMNSKV